MNDFTIKPKDFINNILWRDDLIDSIADNNKKFRREKKIIPEEGKTCYSCLYCAGERCSNPRSPLFKKQLTSAASCSGFIPKSF